ncbi:superoxide dismutase family protein [Rhodoferax sp.]|uniref:superoxide dismutase family protein n=1 Tax=Rhodoferax sp. TaxID=50421 RepID=UPI0027314878|nr:superoxide dismutase family protein [Rhodoferax sp.]MDP1943007.1 superoxide dismutase family protein [Rhodoferax sp.]
MKTPLILLASIALLGACASTPPGPRASAQLQSTTGNAASGSVTFVQAGSKVLVSGEVRGLKPNAEHGFHVHEKGDCSSGDGMCTGGHFNPTGAPHGSHGAGMHHAGDLQSLKADAAGVAKFSFESGMIAVGSGVTDVVGKGLIVHRDPDDYKTQPTGNSGPRLACAIINRS